MLLILLNELALGKCVCVCVFLRRMFHSIFIRILLLRFVIPTKQ